MSRENNQMAYIAEVTHVMPIPDADAIEKLVINAGWPVVAKKNEFKVGDLVVYIEIDAFVPTEIAPFLSKGMEPREYNGVRGERLKSVKLRGQKSQGLVLPLNTMWSAYALHRLSEFPEFNDFDWQSDWDENTAEVKGMYVGDKLGIQKVEDPETFKAGNAKGSFPGYVPKTDEERAQNLAHDVRQWHEEGRIFEWSEKIEGTSFTAIFDNGTLEVCSRNLMLREGPDCAYWKQARTFDIEGKVKALNRNLAIQAEMYGSSISGNIYKMTKQTIAVFKVYDIDQKRYLTPTERDLVAGALGLPVVPVIGVGKLPAGTVDELLAFADGKSVLGETMREGLVFNCVDDPEIHFKVVSDQYLLKKGR